VSDKRLLYLSYAEIEALGVTMADVIDALEIAFREKGQGKVEEHKI
jgi:ornithine cyclodeaminase/alanine dehydrogenase-like protein (mu-crystallin family)